MEERDKELRRSATTGNRWVFRAAPHGMGGEGCGSEIFLAQVL